MIVYSKYIDSKEYTWYDSSNVLFSECIDRDGDKKSLKITFKQGRTYLYQDVDVKDYVMFKNSSSNGSAFNQYIKQYQAMRLPDVSIEELDAMRKKFEEESIPNVDVFNHVAYHIDYNNETKEFRLKLGDMQIFEGVDGNVSALKLLKSMNIAFSLNAMSSEEWDKSTEENNTEDANKE